MAGKTSDGIAVSIDFSNGIDTCVLCVGRKKNRVDMEVINAFHGKEAWELYQKLITPKKK